MEEVAEIHKGKRVLVVSHGAIIGIILRKLLPEQFEKIKLDNTSVTLLRKRNGKWECPLFNCTKHLTDIRIS